MKEIKIHLYKILFIDGDNEPQSYDAIDGTQVVGLQGLREEFLWAMNNGKIPNEVFTDYMSDPYYKDENWDDKGNLSAETMVDILNDLLNYGCSDFYYIIETDLILPETELTIGD